MTTARMETLTTLMDVTTHVLSTLGGLVLVATLPILTHDWISAMMARLLEP